MSKLQLEKLSKEFESIDLDPSSLMFFIAELVIAMSEAKPTDIIYSKSYFSRYYCIDLDTFHKWVRLFCPNLWNEEYKRKRKFTIDEASYILGKLGRLSFNNAPPQFRKDLMNEIYKDEDWKKSRGYQEIKLELDDRFPDENTKINKLPPKMIFEILEEEIEGYEKITSNSDVAYYGIQIQVLYKILTKYSNISDHKQEVHRRYFKIMLASSQKNNGVSKD